MVAKNRTASGRSRFQNLSKMAKNAMFWVFGVPTMSMKQAICIGTDLDNGKAPWGTMQ